MLGLDRPPEGRRRFGLRVHVEMAPWTPYVEVHWAAGSEAYVTPVGDDLVGIAMLTERQAPFDELLAEHALLKRAARPPAALADPGCRAAAPALDRARAGPGAARR